MFGVNLSNFFVTSSQLFPNFFKSFFDDKYKHPLSLSVLSSGITTFVKLLEYIDQPRFILLFLSRQ